LDQDPFCCPDSKWPGGGQEFGIGQEYWEYYEDIQFFCCLPSKQLGLLAKPVFVYVLEKDKKEKFTRGC